MQRKVAFSVLLLVGIFCLIAMKWDIFNGQTGVMNSIHSILSFVTGNKQWHDTGNTRIIAFSGHPINVSQMLAASAEEDYFRFVLLYRNKP